MSMNATLPVELDSKKINALDGVHKNTVSGEYWVRIDRVDKVTKQLDQLARRAQKMEVAPVEYVWHEEKHFPKTRRTIDGEADMTGYDKEAGLPLWAVYWVAYQRLTVTGPAPRFDGWGLLGRIIHPGESGAEDLNVINAVPGATIPDTYRTVKPWCEHCKTKRQRKDSFLCKSTDTGAVVQVGSNCLADFLGHKSPEYVVAAAMLASDLAAFGPEDDMGDGGWGAGVSAVTLRGLLIATINLTALEGWRTAAQAEATGRCPSKEYIIQAFFGKPKTEDERKRKDAILADKPDSVEKAEKIIAWVKTLEPKSDFEWNLKAVGSGEMVSERVFGFACALVGAYDRHVSEEIERNQLAAVSQHVGTPGQRLTLEVQTNRVIETPGMYGFTSIHVMKDRAGNVLKWFATGIGNNLQIGVWVRVDGTVKSHGDYKGVKETVLTRVKKQR